MTVLSAPPRQRPDAGFAPRGRYSYLNLLFRFALDWYVDLPWVRQRIRQTHSGIEFSKLFRDIITADVRAGVWAQHPQASEAVSAAFRALEKAWTGYLAEQPDRDQLALEYLADALTCFREITSRA